MKETEIAYIAGFFDGEGCVAPEYRRGKNKNQKGSCLVIQFSNTNKESLEFIKKIFGGALNAHHERAEWKVRWHLTLSSNQAKNCLEIMKPYLIIKSERAELGIKLQGLIRSERKNQPQSLTTEEINSRKEIIDKIRLLNKKGFKEET